MCCSTGDPIMGHLVKQALEKSSPQGLPVSLPESHAQVHWFIFSDKAKELGFTWATTSEARLFRSYDDVVLLHDAADDNMWESCTSCRQHWWRKLVGAFLNGSILKDRCDKCGSPIFWHSAATECGVDDQGHTHSRGNFVLLLVMSAVTGLK